MIGAYDFALTDLEEKRSEMLLRDSVIVDMCSFHPGGARIFNRFDQDLVRSRLAIDDKIERLCTAMALPYQFAVEGISNAIREWWGASGITAGGYWFPGIRESELDLIERIFLPLHESLSWLKPARTARDIRDAHANNCHALYGFCQPNFGLPLDAGQVEQAYQRGLRSLMLTYNRMDVAGVGCTERVDAGLSDFGLGLVKTCNDIGIIVDTSHCGRATTLDICKYSKHPVTANHTSAAGLHKHARAKSDSEVRAIADTGGVIGVVTVPFFLTSESNPSIEVMLDHFDYLIDLAGWRHVGIGTDWPIQAPADIVSETLGAMLAEMGFRAEDRADTSALLTGYEDGRDLLNIVRGLIKRGYDDQQIRGVLGENFLRVFETVCG